jgi:hypothetical protein
MQWFWLTRQNSVQDHVLVMPGDGELFSLLVAEGALDLSMDFEKIFNLMKKSLDNSLPMHDYDDIVRNMETIMTRLGVLPFDENSLPPEDPRTY